MSCWFGRLLSLDRIGLLFGIVDLWVVEYANTNCRLVG